VVQMHTLTSASAICRLLPVCKYRSFRFLVLYMNQDEIVGGCVCMCMFAYSLNTDKLICTKLGILIP
jgi:hypothetical protein